MIKKFKTTSQLNLIFWSIIFSAFMAYFGAEMFYSKKLDIKWLIVIKLSNFIVLFLSKTSFFAIFFKFTKNKVLFIYYLGLDLYYCFYSVMFLMVYLKLIGVYAFFAISMCGLPFHIIDFLKNESSANKLAELIIYIQVILFSIKLLNVNFFLSWNWVLFIFPSSAYIIYFVLIIFWAVLIFIFFGMLCKKIKL